jgi:translocation protein SEC66
MVNWLSLAVPLAYLGVLIGSLATFSSLYRKRKARTSLFLSLWNPIYLCPDSVLFFALCPSHYVGMESSAELTTPLPSL